MSDSDEGFVPPFSDPEFASKAGKKGAAVTNAKFKKKAIALEDLGELETLEDAKRWLMLIARGLVAGHLDRKDCDVAIRALREWRECHGGSLATADLADLREEMAEMKDSLGPRVA